jgi:hypothetical protein
MARTKPLSKQVHKQSTFWTDFESIYFRHLEPADIGNILRAVRKSDKLDIKR